MSEEVILIVAGAVVGLIFIFGIGVMIAKFYRQVDQGTALIVNTMQDVDDWHAFLVDNGVRILAEPRTHRDGARSFYCADPDGTTVQLIYHPPLSTNE